jgi:integrase
MQTPQAVTLVLRCKTKKGWRRYPAVIRNGKLRPHCAMVPTTKKQGGKSRTIESKEEKHVEGTYELRTYQGRDTLYQALGADPEEALKVYDAARNVRKAIVMGDELGVDVSHLLPGFIPLSYYLDKLVQAKKDDGLLEAFDKMRIAGNEFLAPLRKGITPEEITEDLIKVYLNKLRREGYAKRTVKDRLRNIKGLLRSTKIQISEEIQKLKAPKPEEKLPEYFTKAQRDAFFAACNTPRETLVFQLALTLGVRDQELMFLEMSDIDFETMTVTIHSKTENGFRIKDGEERRMPLRRDVAELIRAYDKAHPGIRWLTCRPDGEPDHHLLKIAKRIGKRAGLTCRVFLHKFRSTYATQLLRDKVDLRTVQILMGHTDIKTTTKYLRAIEAENKQLQTTINNIDF